MQLNCSFYIPSSEGIYTSITSKINYSLFDFGCKRLVLRQKGVESSQSEKIQTMDNDTYQQNTFL